MEAGEYGLTRGTCFVACRLEVVAVAGLLWISWCVLGAAFFFCSFFFFERTRPAASMRPPCLISLSTSNEARPRERINRGHFCLYGKKASSCRGAYRSPLFNLSVCLSACLSVCPVCLCTVCLTFVVLLITRAVRDRLPQTRDLWKRASVD